MKKIVFIVPYFGEMKNYYELWLKSCEYNPSIDWLIFTDQGEKLSEKRNVKIVTITFSEFKKIVKRHFDFEIALDKPYKLCDFKPAYGEIFQDYITQYDFWGYCDMDLIFGDIRKFITEEILNNYNKILRHGHFTLIHNDPESNAFYKISVPGKNNYKAVFSSPENFAFDEWGGISSILDVCKIPQYNKMIYADVNFCYNFIQLVNVDVGYIPQVFIWQRGRLFRKYYYEGRIQEEEFLYIHLQKRKMKIEFEMKEKIDTFLIGPHTFFIDHFEQYSEENLENINAFKLFHKEWLVATFFWVIKNKWHNRLKK